ncbi:type IV secretory system conjugative DNA transfer family protein, partial [Candidatus Parcubacteria bacterium]|nr:type IV secretory system conjugative DNA transfer family protein [Candidatus Parcubacteria bacterium]
EEVNLSKGKVGEVNATLLGSMLVTKIYLAAMSRADVTANILQKLPSFYFYVDEFQNFANQSFADILSEARKYKLNLIIAHQYIEQMEEEVRDAVFGNVGTTVSFRVGPFDAEVLETIFQPQFTATDLVNLGFAQVYLTLMIDGVGSPPFSATTLHPFDLPPQRFVPQVVAHSRTQFGKPRKEVEEAIAKWNEIDKDEPRKNNEFRPPPRPQAPRPTVSVPIVSSTPPPPPPRTERPAPAVHPTPEVKEHIARSHTMAQSKGYEPRPVDNRPPRPPEPPRPQLEGSTSLKDALEKVARSRPAPDLGDTLARVVKEDPSGLPEEELRDMLHVDEPHQHQRSEQN